MFEDLDHNLPGQAWKLLDMKKKSTNWHTFGRTTINSYASLQTSLDVLLNVLLGQAVSISI